MTRDELVAAVTAKAEGDARVLALFLSGSLGAGSGDVWSDADLVVAVAPEEHAGFVAEARRWAEVTPLVMWKPPHPGLPLFTALTEGWVRFDVTVTVPGRLTGARDRWRALVDRAGLFERLPETLPPKPPEAAQVEGLVVEFIRMLGLLPVGVGRGEYAVGVTGVGLMRQQVIQLMLMELDLPQPPGALHLSRLLPPKAMAEVEALPCPAPTREGVIEATRACAAAFLPRARRLSERVGAPWPEAMERAARLHLERTLGFRWPA